MTEVLTDDHSPILTHFARKLADSHRELAAVWLTRLDALLAVDASGVFPGHQLLDHIPDLILEIAAYLAAPSTLEIASNTAVMAKAEELGLLRFEQQASVHQVLREYQIFHDVLDEFFQVETVALGVAANPAAAVKALVRAHQAIRVLEQQTVDALVRRYTEAIERQNSRLRGFSRMVSHEIRQPLGVLQTLATALRVDGDEAARARLLQLMGRNVERLGELSTKLELLARLTRRPDGPGEQHVLMTNIARDVAAQLAEMADARGVAIVVDDDLPAITADAGRIELVLVNLLANAIKYSDPDKDTRVVRIERDRSLPQPAIRVHDNGIGIPAGKLPVIFDQFVRVHTHLDAELQAHGMGLGLSIVRECMDAMDGTVTVESREGIDTTFHLRWPASALVPPSGKQG
jgi:signal transduction histidine kinase